MKVGSVGAAGASDQSDDCAFVDFLPFFYEDAGHVQVSGRDSLAVIDADGPAMDVEHSGNLDGAGRRGVDRRAGSPTLVEPRMDVAGGLAVIEALDAIG